MSKTLVNIITEDNPIPAYLFIKEKYEVGDRLMYVSAKDTEDDLDALSICLMCLLRILRKSC